jgi:hypothetical protein
MGGSRAAAATVVGRPGERSLIRVASVPAGHVYVRHLSAPDDLDGVVRLADPRPCTAPSDQSVWWPPAMLDAGWIERHHDEFDVFHIHFGFDAESVESLDAVVGMLRRHRKPLVYTVHDLRNPHHSQSEVHDAHLDVLIPAADQVITLTEGAAAAITHRWGTEARVIGHPHVAPAEVISVPRSERGEFVIGVHVKSVRANMDPLPVIDMAVDTVATLPGAVLRVDMHTEVTDPASIHYRAELVSYLQDAARRRALRLRIHNFFTDDQLWCYLRDEIDVSVLPYRFGTHSGWLEACHDLGTTVIAPDCGFYRQQQPCLDYRHNETRFDAASLALAITEAYRSRPRWRAQVSARMLQRAAIADEHRLLYERVLG